MSFICQQLGYSRQAYYKALRYQGQKKRQYGSVKEAVLQFRRLLPRVGTRKLHYLLSQHQPHLSIGRDGLFWLLRREGLLVQKKRRYQKTTDSRHWMRRYPNSARGLNLHRPEQLWVADITYLSLEKGYCYLHLLTDAYSKVVVGYHLSSTLAADQSERALQAALKGRSYQNALMHHSDRGLQYCSTRYTEVLKSHGISISMTQDGSPYDNAVAERINGILKDEFGLDDIFESIGDAEIAVHQAIKNYNTKRPHLSNHYLTPLQMHGQEVLKPKKWNKKNHQKSTISDGS